MGPPYVSEGSRFLTDSAATARPRFPSCRHRFTTLPGGSNWQWYGKMGACATPWRRLQTRQAPCKTAARRLPF